MEKEKLLKTIKILLQKYRQLEEVKFEPKFIEDILFSLNEDGTKSINNEIFYILRENNIDMNGVSFNKVHINRHQFNGFKNITINIDEIPDKDLSETVLEGVRLIGSLNGANIKQTNFKGYIGNLVLDPQTIKDKDLYFTKLHGITVNGSFDDVYINCTDFRGAKGIIEINPQKVRDKKLAMTYLEGVSFIGNYNEQTNNYDKPCFDNCYLVGSKLKGEIEINPQKLSCKTIAMCQFENVIFTDTFDGVITENTLFNNCTYINIQEQKFLQVASKILSLYKK